MRLCFAACFSMVCAFLAAPAVHAQAAADTTLVVAPSPAPRTSMEALEHALSTSHEYEDAMIVAYTGVGLLLAGAVMVPLALLSPLFVRDAQDPMLAGAIGLGSLGLVLDVVGIVMMFDAMAHLPPIDDGHYPM